MHSEIIIDCNDFTYATLHVINKQVLRMGIAGNYGLVSSDVEWAAEQGASYWLCGRSYRKVTAGIKRVISKDRDKHVVAYLGWGFLGSQVRRNVERTLRELNTDYLDVYKLSWLGRASFDSRGVMDVMLKLKEEGKIRAIGTSIHDRKRAGQLAGDSDFDLFMIRYNAKHPGAEDDIFPHLNKRNPALVSYTALAWGQLIKRVSGIEMESWPGKGRQQVPPLTPNLCYRFVLSNPNVHLVLTGPKNRDQLKSNLEALRQGPLSSEELDWIRMYGQEIRSKKKFDYIP